MRAVGYLTGTEAIDVARITGLPLSSGLDRLGGEPDIAAEAVRATDWVYFDLTRLPWWDAFRVAWVRIGVHHYLNAGQEERCDYDDGPRNWRAIRSSTRLSPSSVEVRRGSCRGGAGY